MHFAQSSKVNLVILPNAEKWTSLKGGQMMNKFTKRLAMLLAVTVLASLMAGCNGNTDAEATPAPTQGLEQTADPTATPAPTAKKAART